MAVASQERVALQGPGAAQGHIASVVVCCYTEDRWDDLMAALEGLESQTRTPDEVIIVVDHNEALLQRVSAARGLHSVVANSSRRGLSGARNTGLEVARGDVIAFLDDDAVPEPDWLERLLAPFVDDRVLVVGGVAEPGWTGTRPLWWPEEFDWVVGCSHRGLPVERARVRNVLGATMAFRSDVFAHGLRFAEVIGRVGATPYGCEETELCIRIGRRWPERLVLLEPSARVRHRVSRERQSVRYFLARCYAEGRSKAVVSRLAGLDGALRTERRYVARTLTSGIAASVGATVVAADPAGLARAAAIGAGLATTTVGFLVGRATGTRAQGPSGEARRPVALLELELSDPGDPPTVAGYDRARVLVRGDRRPVGVADVPLRHGRVSGEQLAEIRAAYHHVDTSGGGSDETRGRSLSVSVVIATHDRPGELRRCLESVLAAAWPDVQVVVVDNAPSSEATRIMMRDFPSVEYVREPVPGLARAHNAGLRVVTGEVVAFTDDDVVVDRDWLLGIVSVFARDPAVACVTGLIWPAQLDTPGQLLIEEHGGFAKGFETRRFDLHHSRPPDPLFPYAAGRMGSGANMSFRTEVLRRLGGFDPALGAGSRGRGGDDLQAFFNVVATGHALVYEPAATVYHHHRRGLADARTQALGYGAGLTAYLTSLVTSEPRHLPAIVRLAPRGARHVWDGAATHGSRRGARGLLAWQVIGMASGPWSYLRGRRAARRRAEVRA